MWNLIVTCIETKPTDIIHRSNPDSSPRADDIIYLSQSVSSVEPSEIFVYENNRSPLKGSLVTIKPKNLEI